MIENILKNILKWNMIIYANQETVSSPDNFRVAKATLKLNHITPTKKCFSLTLTLLKLI